MQKVSVSYVCPCNDFAMLQPLQHVRNCCCYDNYRHQVCVNVQMLHKDITSFTPDNT